MELLTEELLTQYAGGQLEKRNDLEGKRRRGEIAGAKYYEGHLLIDYKWLASWKDLPDWLQRPASSPKRQGWVLEDCWSDLIPLESRHVSLVAEGGPLCCYLPATDELTVLYPSGHHTQVERRWVVK
jgi:hypothetical protein